jgi:hypothetical protein
MLQCSLNTNLIVWVVGAMIPLPMVPCSRHKDNGLDGCLEFGRDMCKFTSRVKGFEVEAPTRHFRQA